MEFTRVIEVGGELQELVFRSWDDGETRRIMVVGLDKLAILEYSKVLRTWNLVEREDIQLLNYERLLSDLINEELSRSDRR